MELHIGNYQSWLGTWSQFYRNPLSFIGLAWRCLLLASQFIFGWHSMRVSQVPHSGSYQCLGQQRSYSRCSKIFRWKKKQIIQWKLFNRKQSFIRKGDLLFVELCDLVHLTYPSCDFFPLIYKMGTNYSPHNIAEALNGDTVKKCWALDRCFVNGKLQHINY